MLFCCGLKILYYVVLISYHLCDCVFDWLNYFKLSSKWPFAGVGQFLFCFSCSFGSEISLAMIVVYAYYIILHGQRICRHCQGYEPVYKTKSQKCQCRSFNELELLFSILELFGKDAIQSIMLYHFYKSQQNILEEPTVYFLVFSICSLAAHLKLCACFLTKLCGRGEGEESCSVACKSDSKECAKVVKVIACLFGFTASAMCLVLTIVSIKGSFQDPADI